MIAQSYRYNQINQKLSNDTDKVNQTQRVLTGFPQASSAFYETTCHTSNYLLLKDTAYINKTLASLETIRSLTIKPDTPVATKQAQGKRLRALSSIWHECKSIGEGQKFI